MLRRGCGIIKALKGRYGKKLFTSDVRLHKDRNIQRHLPNAYRKRAHSPLRDRLGAEQLQGREEDVAEFERWRWRHQRVGGGFTPSALEEVLTLHRLKVPALLRKSLHSTNPIESMFSMVLAVASATSNAIGTAKCDQRWLAAVPVLHCERRFRRVKGYASIDTAFRSHRCDPTRDRNARRVSSGRKSGT